MTGDRSMAVAAPPSPEPLLAVADLEVIFPGRRSLFVRSPDVRAVDGVSFTIAPGETLGLVGESGSGKTTVGRALLRFVEPSSGDIEFAGTPLSSFGRHTPDSYRRAVQVVFQDPYASLNPRRSIGDTISDPLTRHRSLSGTEVEREVASLLDRVGLPGRFARRYPVELSGGQRQRVAIARALAMRPQLIVCDEAVSALDVSTQSQVINLLEDLQDEFGMSYLFIAHDLAVVKHISHRIAVMYRGRIVESADAERIYHQPAHPYTKMLIDAIPEPHPRRQKERRRQRRAQLQSPNGPEPDTPAVQGCTFAPRCPHAMEVCTNVVPEPSPLIGGGMTRCHLQTSGPELAGRPLAELEKSWTA